MKRAYLQLDVGIVSQVLSAAEFAEMSGTPQYRARWAECPDDVAFMDGAVRNADGTATFYGPAPTDTSIMTETGWQEAV